MVSLEPIAVKFLTFLEVPPEIKHSEVSSCVRLPLKIYSLYAFFILQVFQSREVVMFLQLAQMAH